MFQRVNSLYSALGVSLFLIALYLVLERGANASSIITAAGSTTANIFKTLQGR